VAHADAGLLAIPWTYSHARKHFSGIIEGEAFMVGPGKASIEQLRDILLVHDERHKNERTTMGSAMPTDSVGALSSDPWIRGGLYRALPQSDAMVVEIVGSPTLPVGGSADPYQVRTALNSDYWDSPDWSVREVHFEGRTPRGVSGGLFTEDLYPQPPDAGYHQWTVWVAYEGFEVGVSYATSDNTYGNSGSSFWYQLTGVWTPQEMIWTGSSGDAGVAIEMLLQMVNNSEVGETYRGYIDEADIYLDGPVGMYYWVEVGDSGPIPFSITAD